MSAQELTSKLSALCINRETVGAMRQPPQPIEIKKATVEQANALEDFLSFNHGENYRQLARKYINCMFSQDYRKPVFLIAVEGGEVIAAASFSEELFTVSTWGIGWVSVHPERRNSGLGKVIVDACLVEISNAAQETVTAILATHPGQTRLYEKSGFRVSGYTHEGGWFMTKTLLRGSAV